MPGVKYHNIDEQNDKKEKIKLLEKRKKDYTDKTYTKRQTATDKGTKHQDNTNANTKYWGSFNVFSIITAQWLTPLLRTAYERGLNEADLYRIAPEDSAEKSRQVLTGIWNDEVKRRGGDASKASLGLVVLRFIWWRLLASLLLILVSETSLFLLAVVSIRGLLVYAENPDAPIYHGVLYAISAFVFTLLGNIAIGLQFYIAASTGARLRGGLVAFLFQRVLRMRGLGNKSLGDIVNLCVNDSTRLLQGMSFSPMIIGAPVIFLWSSLVTYSFMGPSALVGMAVYVIVYVITLILTGAKVEYFARMMKHTDIRIQIVAEMLSCIKFIKMYVWEDFFEEKVKSIRRKELRYLAVIGILRGIQKNSNTVLPIAATVATIMVRVRFQESITPSMVFTYLAVLFNLRTVLLKSQYGHHCFSETLVAILRFQEALAVDEFLPISANVDNKSNAIEMKLVSVCWDKCGENETILDEGEENNDSFQNDEEYTSGTATSRSDINEKMLKARILEDISFSCKKGSLVGICGSVGSGKTTLLNTILQHTNILDGTVAVDGSVAYTSQHPNIFSATLRDNITMFGSHDDEKVVRENRYRKAVQICCLADDIATFPTGDSTEIGERGINLSGGQKQRVSLARAVYADRDIYLLDDPLAAVDVNVAYTIFTECFKGVLKDKTVIWATSQLQFLSECDEVIVMEDGKITERGAHTRLMENNSEYARLVQCSYMDHNKTTDDHPPVRSTETKDIEAAEEETEGLSNSKKYDVINQEENEENEGRLVMVETRKVGAVGAKTYLAYCRYAGGVFACALAFILFALAPASAAFSNVWLSYWLNLGSGQLRNISDVGFSSEVSTDIADNPQFGFYRDVYSYSLLIVVVICALRIAYYVKVTTRASFHIHQSLYTKVFASPMSFFDTSPSGRILNLFSRDIDEVENEVSHVLETAMWTMLTVLAGIIVIITVFPWFLIFVCLTALVFMWETRLFVPGIRDMKRIENVMRSPLLSHIKAGIEARSTIHAFGIDDNFVQRCHHLLDNSTVPNMLFQLAQRWLAFRLDLMVSVAEMIIGLSVTFTHGTTAASFAGLALSYSVPFLILLELGVRMMTITHARFTSVERITSFIDRLKTEENTNRDTGTTDDWPKQGCIAFESVGLRYRDHLPLVLKGISFRINAKEKVGIVGRTGSGKSSIAIALFRLVEAASGRIFIDDVDIARVNLRELRSKISIIPQDPVLFTGTLRYNLDPYNQFSDAQMWNALEKTYMKQKIAGIKHQLEASVRESGSNFSAGERQLLCLARALVRNSKILFLDEATASVDTETDSLIQATIRSAFSDCTVLTIAHRLHTVLDSDRILVMDNGKVLEIDTPKALLADPKSRFSTMLNTSQESEIEGI